MAINRAVAFKADWGFFLWASGGDDVRCRKTLPLTEAVFDCSIRDGSFVKHGSIVITEINESEVKTQFLEGRSEANFDSDLDKIHINELDLGAPEYLSASQISPSSAWDNGSRNLSCVALPWVNNESGNIQNCPKYENGKYVWHSDTRGLSWQPYLLFVVKRICEALSAGEKKQKSEFYDKIYIGWWDGAAAYDGKLPYPYVDDVVINDDWSGYFRPHTSLRLNDANANVRRSVYAINPKQKVTFKFLSDTLPNPRSVFLIHGKRYLCEKITATFTQNGMSQLFKGDFWSITD